MYTEDNSLILLHDRERVLSDHEPTSSSPELYLDMKPEKGKGLTFSKLEKPDDTILTKFYESLGNVPFNQTTIFYNDKAKEEILRIYKGFTAEQTIDKCQKSGPLYRRQDDKWIFKERACFIGLVGRHFSES